ncbi:MAG: M28 family peptidase, partial [Bacteroidota bacterium]
MNKRIIFLTSSIVGLACLLPAQLTRNPQITTDELRHHVRYLASDELEGRRAGSAGAEKAAAYLASEFKTYGLMPAGDNGTYLQQFDFVAGVRLTSNLASYTTQGRSTTLKVDQDYRPLGFSMSGEFSGEVVFAGYGISAPSLGYDDYARLDVKGKAVIVFRFTPKLDTLQREFTQFASLRYKASKAKELGATALIVVT